MPEQMITCSFCRKKVKVHDQYDMPIYDPNTGFAICKNCIKEIHHFPTLPRNQKTRIKKSKEFQRFSLLFYRLYGIIF